MSYLIGSVVGLLLGVWLIVSAFHIMLTIVGWVLVVASAVALVKYLTDRRKGHHGSLA